ncbi:hypothetical protein PG996_004268 [Apiospora saccharicola]|uniref:F-box domain-containing protein n=1 Tax=Apiospora saccharicola TaxID=335842 RepID=A0ABR1W3R5_9PEZI
MAVGLESCPTEIIDSIAKYLDVTDAGSLRLVSRCLRAKATQAHFRSNFRSKRVRVINYHLKKLEVVTQRGSLGCEIRDLTLVGVVNNTKRLEEIVERHPKDAESQRHLEILQERRREYEQSRDSGLIVRLLSDAFKNTAAHTAARKLHSLSLEVVVYRHDADHELPPVDGGSWRLIWQSAAETFRIVFAALQESQLQVDELNLYNGSQLRRCSMAVNEFSSTLGSVRSLSISVSDRILDLAREERESGDSADEISNYSTDSDEDLELEAIMLKAHDPNNFTGLADLISACSNLRSLSIHQYGLDSRYIYRKCIFQCGVATLARLPPIEQCTLSGVFLDENDLLAFLEKTSASLRALSMQTVTKVGGSPFRVCFDYIASGHVPNLEYLYMNGLSDFVRPGHFTGVDEPKPPWEGKEEVRRPILCYMPLAIPALFPAERQKWAQDHRREYGVPTACKF